MPVPTGYLGNFTGEEIDEAISRVRSNRVGVNRNLLDNWYFVGGGSQQGGGQFPINQRGQTSYTGIGYGIDRWAFSDDDLTLTITDNGIQVSLSSGVSGRKYIAQKTPYSLKGKTLTFSMLTQENHLVTGTNVFPSSSYINIASIPDVCDIRLFNSSDGTDGIYIILNVGASVSIVAAKLELGDTQTLAYQDEEGNWQLFETPDYAEELAKCQRYQLNLPYGNTANFSPIGFGYAITDTQVRILIPNPSTMRTNPSISYLQGDISGITLIGGGLELIPTAVSNIIALSYGVSVIFAVSGATPKESYAMRMTKSYMMLDANL